MPGFIYGSFTWPRTWPIAPWMYVHEIETYQQATGIAGQANPSLSAATQSYIDDLYGNPIYFWDEGGGVDKDSGRSALFEKYLWQGQSEAHWQIRLGYGDRARMISALLGGYAGSGGGSGAGSGYDEAGLFQDPETAEGIPGATKYCVMRITFRSLDYTTEDSGFLELDYSSQVLAAASGNTSGYKWSGNGTNWYGAITVPAGSGGSGVGSVASDVLVGIPISLVSFTRTLKNVGAIPVSSILAATDTVSSATFYGAAAGLVKFETANTITRAQGYSPTGSGFLWDVKYNFTYRRYPWNMLWNPDIGGFQEILDPNGNPIFGTFDYNTLFPAETQPIT
jgi:hypothetical protein